MADTIGEAGSKLRAQRRRLRDARIIRQLAAGQTIEEVAAREEISPRRARERVSAMLARRAADPPAEFVQMQIQRLNEAMLVAYGAMSGGNLKAVDRVVKITREFDRYHGFALSLAAPALARLIQPSALPALAPPALAMPALALPAQNCGATLNGVLSD